MTPLRLAFLVAPVLLAGLILFSLHRLRAGAARWPALATLAWFCGVFVLARAGVLARLEALPPRLPLLALGFVAVGLALSRRREVREAVHAMPAWWPVALQSFRAPLEVGLYALFSAGLMPRQMTFAGANLDLLVGLSAPVMALLLAKRGAPRWLQAAWQLGAVALLINVVRIAVTSAPGPLHVAWPGEPLTVVAEWPFALIPAFFVPVATLGHVAALVKLARGDVGFTAAPTTRMVTGAGA